MAQSAASSPEAWPAVNPVREQIRPLEQQAATARLLHAHGSPNQLEEVLTEFWFNHFNVYAGKGPVGVLVADYEARAIRPHVLGRFRDLLGATASTRPCCSTWTTRRAWPRASSRAAVMASHVA